MMNRAFLYSAILIALFIFFMYFLFYFGGVSFIAKFTKTQLCKMKSDSACNASLYLHGPYVIQDQEGNKDESRWTQNLVLLHMTKGSIVGWGVNGIRAFTIVPETAYGVTVTFSYYDKAWKKIERLIREGILHTSTLDIALSSASNFSSSKVAYSGSIPFRTFTQVVQPGNLINVIYYKSTNVLVDVALRDLSVL